jgi:hypothetical protein
MSTTLLQKNTWQLNANQLTKVTFERFAVRDDGCGLYGDDGSSFTNHLKGGNDELRGILNKHFRGIQTAGLHPQTADSRCLWFGVDIDCKEWWPDAEQRASRNLTFALAIAEKLERLGFHVIIEASNGIGAYHIWVRLDSFVPQLWVYHFLQEQISDAEELGFGNFTDGDGSKQNDFPETFPKQASVKGGFGNWLRLPGRHHRLDWWSRFVGYNGELLSYGDTVQAWIDFPASDHKLIPEYIPPEVPKPSPQKIVAASATGVNGCRAAAQQHIESLSWHELLTSFKWQDCGGGKWRRPGKPSGGHSAILNDIGLHVFSSAVADLESDQTYGKWRFYVCSLGFTMEGSGQVEAARSLFGADRAAQIDKESQRAFAERQEASQPVVNLSGILSSSELTKEVDEVWIVFNAVDEADLQAEGAVVVRAPAAGEESFTDWSVLAWRRVHIIDGGNSNQAANIVSLVSHYAKESTVEIHPLHAADEKGKTLAVWFAENQISGNRLQALRNIPFDSSQYATKPVEQIETEQGRRPKNTAETDSQKWRLKSVWDAVRKPAPMREVIIEGLARRGEVVNIVASTKVGKSWLALMLAFCVATGRKWFNRNTKRGRVLLLDNELHDETIQNRMKSVSDAMRIYDSDERDAFEYVDLRGKPVGLGDIEIQLSSFQPGELTLVVLDAKYRFFSNGMQENSNDDQTAFHNGVDQLAKRLDCVIVLIHHATKGDQGSKSVTDIGSGGGAQSRTVDCHMVLRPHENGDDFAVLDAAVRTFAPVQSQTLKWDFPLWSLDDTTEPVVKQAQNRNEATVERSQKTRIGTILDMLRRSPDKIATENKLSGNNPSRTSFRAALNELEESGEIEFVPNYTPPRRSEVAPAWRLCEGSHRPTSTHTPHYK